MKDILKTLIKFTLAFGLIFYLTKSGRLNFSILSEMSKYPTKFVITLLCFFLILCIVNLRYSLILSTKLSKKIPITRLLRYNWIGMFFNSVLPGSVSGDFVKIFYIKDEDKKLNMKFMFGSVIVDRILGLVGLVIILGVSTVINYEKLTNLSPDIKKLLDLNLVLFTLVITALACVIFFQKLPSIILNPLSKINITYKFFSKILSLWDALCQFRPIMIKLIALSIILQSLSIIVFWYLAESFSNGSFTIDHALSLVPVGFITIAIPISPAGLGVGHAVFHSLLGLVGITNGADLFNLYFFMILLFNLFGVVPYLLTKSKKQISFQNLDDHNEEI